MDYEILGKLDDERTIAVLFLSMASYAFVSSYTFSEEAALWPRIISAIAIVGSILILGKNYLPGAIGAIVEDEPQVLESDEELQEMVDTDTDFSVDDAVFTTLAAVGFGVITLLIGYVAATVLFILAFSRYFEVGVKMTILFLAISLGVVIGVGNALNMPLFEGLLGFGFWR